MVNDTKPQAPAGGPSPSRSGLAVVYLTVFIDLLGFGIILPLLPFYARSFGASGLWVGVLMTAYSAAQFVGAPVLGRLSDLYGRRPLILIALAGSTASLTLAGFATSLPLLIAARALAGLFGGSIAAAQAYVADVTTPQERSKYMGLLGASIGMGFVFGPAIGAGLAGYGFGTAAFVAAGIAFLNLVAAAFRLKESRTHAGKAGGRRLSFAGLGPALQDQGVRPLLLAMFFLTFGFVGMETTYALLGEARFGLTAGGLGYVFTYIGVVVVLVQGGIVGRVAKKRGERAVALTGFVLMAVGLAAVGWASALPYSVAALGVVAAGQALTQPTLATMLSRCAGTDDQGGVLGLGQSLAALARATGPVAAGWLFDRNMGWPYVAGAVLCLGAAGLVSSRGLARTLAARGVGGAEAGARA